MMGSAGDVPLSSALVIYNEGSHLGHSSSEWRTSRSWLEPCMWRSSLPLVLLWLQSHKFIGFWILSCSRDFSKCSAGAVNSARRAASQPSLWLLIRLFSLGHSLLMDKKISDFSVLVFNQESPGCFTKQGFQLCLIVWVWFILFLCLFAILNDRTVCLLRKYLTNIFR